MQVIQPITSLDLLAAVATIQSYSESTNNDVHVKLTSEKPNEHVFEIHLPVVSNASSFKQNLQPAPLQQNSYPQKVIMVPSLVEYDSLSPNSSVEFPSPPMHYGRITPPQNNKILKTPAVEAVWEGNYQRRKRLSQNHMYREMLMAKGIFPVKTEDNGCACSLCGETFTKDMFMWRHGVKHLRNKPFKCEYCSSMFNRSDSLSRHVRQFHHEKPGSC